MHVESLSVSKVSSDVDLVLYGCPAIEFSFENASTGTTVIADVFMYDDTTFQFII